MKEGKNKKTKKTGQVFTPKYIVEEMLDYAGYDNPSIIGKHIMDNSCGDGAFLQVVVSRYCDEAMKTGLPLPEIKRDLETYVHGIDTDEVAFKTCHENLSLTAERFGLHDVKWDLYNRSALSMKKFNGKMDFVVGNPPYVRVHNLDSTYDEVKQFKFANGGMTDLYLAFFELGFKMLNNHGKLCYITPSSWLNSLAASNMRQYILNEQNLVSLTDLGHFQAFENATTYTLISLFAMDKKDKEFDYFVFNGQTHRREFVDRISVDDCHIKSYFYLSDKKNLKMLRDIKTKGSIKYVSVKNGFATLADKVFIGDDIPESNITIKVVKASTAKWYKCLFPYDRNGKLLPPDTVMANPAVKRHFESHQEDLLKGRSHDGIYYEYGRTQALQDVWKDKIAISTLLRTEKDIKIEKVNAGEGLYSGLYIINHHGISFEEIKSILVTHDFAVYVSLLKKYKSGGYYTYNSKDVEEYINYFITRKKKNHEKSDFPGQDIRVV